MLGIMVQMLVTWPVMLGLLGVFVYLVRTGRSALQPEHPSERPRQAA